MLDPLNIHSLSDFLRNYQEHLSRLRETRKPEFLTVNGKAEAVLMDPESYQEMLEQIEEAKTLAAIREGLAAAERGEMKPAEQVFAEMKARYGLHG